MFSFAKVSNLVRPPCLSEAFSAASSTDLLVAARSRYDGSMPELRHNPRCRIASSLLQSSSVSCKDSRPYRIFAPTTALKTKSFHVGCALLFPKFFNVVTVARVAVNRAVRSGVSDAPSCSETPRYFASGAFERNVPS